MLRGKLALAFLVSYCVLIINTRGRWVSGSGGGGWAVQEWVEAGAGVVGGCCRVAPPDIAAIYDTLHPKV